MYPYKKLKLRDGSTANEHRLIVKAQTSVVLGPNDVVHHVNGDRFDNRPENLIVMSRADHSRLHFIPFPPRPMTEATKNKLSIANTGQMHPQAKLTDALVRQIRKRLDQGMGVRELAKELGLSHTIISQVGTKKRWGHVAP
jgi:hypothetical protein